MTYLDTGCFVKLYYPEPDSAHVVALIQAKSLFHTPLHELEFTNALQLKVFHNAATAAQASPAPSVVSSARMPITPITTAPAIRTSLVFMLETLLEIGKRSPRGQRSRLAWGLGRSRQKRGGPRLARQLA